MNVKIDTKERFTTITPLESTLSANMTADLSQLLLSHLQKDIPHVVLNFMNVTRLAPEIGKTIVELQQHFYEKNSSFVICELTKNVEKVFEQLDLLEIMNVTPSESEAWDIVQMEEMERDLLKDN